MELKLTPNFFEENIRHFQKFSAGDDFYEMLIDSHRDMTDEESVMLNCKLVLLMANQIGDLAVLRKIIETAKSTT